MSSSGYRLLPLRFHRMPSSEILLTNLTGDYCWLAPEEFDAFVSHRLSPDCSSYFGLLAQHFAFEEGSTAALHLLAAKYRTRQSRLADLAALHIFVVTLRCTNQCMYCQTTCLDRLDKLGDMSRETADHAIDFMFDSPSPYLKVEFQGGEPTLNFDLVKYITERCEERSSLDGRQVEFVLCTNLVEFTEDHARYCRAHKIGISTSLDGPQFIHDRHRNSTYVRVVRGIGLAREYVGVHQVSALMTPTRHSLEHVESIIDEYAAMQFPSVFLRSLHPYGYASESNEIAISTDEWLRFYRRGLEHIFALNRAGFTFREEYAAILLRRILTHNPLGFVDLQSPAGAGTSVLVYFRDGVYPSDEARMLAAMGDDTFRLADLGRANYAETVTSDEFVEQLLQTMTEGVPMCCDCAFQPYCGADPVGHYREQRDSVGHKRRSEFCARHMGIFELLFEQLRGPNRDIMLGWV